jgi:hypothetical protein
MEHGPATDYPVGPDDAGNAVMHGVGLLVSGSRWITSKVHPARLSQPEDHQHRRSSAHSPTLFVPTRPSRGRVEIARRPRERYRAPPWTKRGIVYRVRVRHIADELGSLPGVRTEIYYRKIGNEVPHAGITWDEKAFGLTREECVEGLRRGDPQIEVIGGQYREMVKKEADPYAQSQSPAPSKYLISVVSSTLKPGEEKIVARRLREILVPAANRAKA